MNHMKRLYKYLLIQIIIILLLAMPANAQSLLNPDAASKIDKQAQAMAGKAGFSEVSDSGQGIGEFAAVVINAFFGLLGIIFVSLILLAGYNWMTAQGEEDKVKRAKDSIRSAIIGLVIVIAAYAITYFVFANLDAAMQGFGWSG